MKFSDHLNHTEIRRFNELRRFPDALPIQKELKPENQSAHKKKEELSEREWLELMGTNRDTYKRVNGAWRRK